MESDEQLYLEVRNGSKAAFEKLYARYEGPIYGYIYRRLQSKQDAEEVFHEAMLAIFKGEGLEFAAGGFGGWLFKVSLNLSLNRLRSRKREGRALAAVANDSTSVRSLDNWPDPEDLAAMQTAAAHLSEPLRQVYALRREGRSYEEMSDILGIPLGTVKSRVHLMVTQLRKEMSKWTAQ
ncbi:MAG: RNA polymerase sigma factor [Pseudobdellovibrionaceae bacterium]|nr:RNA polymerase sigma factor [Pseudobdellovibrionaceae bacterium]